MTYQNVVINGIDHGGRKSRIGSPYFNEGKWKNFIEPFLPADCTDMTFVDMGCNAGMHLIMARERGFRNAFGIEMDKPTYDVTSKYVGDRAVVLNTQLVEHFDYSLIPVADVTLLANFHYHISYATFCNYVNIIRRKTKRIIIVSSIVRTRSHCPCPDADSLRRYFKLWREVGHINPLGDTRQTFGICFESELVRMPTATIIDGLRHHKSYFERVKDTTLRRNRRYPYTMPIQMRSDGLVVDGIHKLVTLEQEGYKNALVEVV